MKIDHNQLFEELLSKVMGAETSANYLTKMISERDLDCSLIDLYEPKYKHLVDAGACKRIDKAQIKSWDDVLDMGIPRYLQNETPSYKFPYISAHKKTWGFDRVEWPQDADVSSLILGYTTNHKNWANMVAHALLGCAYSRTPIDLGIEDGDDLYLFHFIRLSSDDFGARTHAYKLGRSKDPERRRISLGGASGCVVLPVLVLKGVGYLEPLIHKAMRERELKDPSSEFYDECQLLSLLACLALLFQQHTQCSLIEVLRDNLDVCAARFPKSSDDYTEADCRLNSSIVGASRHPVVLAINTLFSACHPSHVISDALYLNSVAPMQDIELLQTDMGHSQLGVLAALLGYDCALKISQDYEGEVALESFKYMFGSEEWGIYEDAYWLCAVKGMPTLSFNAFVRLCTSFRFEAFRIWGAGDGHDSTAQSTYRRKLGFLTCARFVKDMMKIMPEVLRLAETKVDMFDICESIAKAVQDDQ